MGRSVPRPYKCDWTININYLCSFVTAKNTLSSTGTVGVNTVDVFPSGNAICFANPLNAGPAGFTVLEVPSPGCIEMRVVVGVQSAAPWHVSRTNTCRSPLFGVAIVVVAAVAALGVEVLAALGALLFVTATNATNLPVALIDGRIASVPVNAPLGSVETSVVAALHVPAAPTHVSRRYTCRPATAAVAVPAAPSTRFVAAELNATYLPSALITGIWLSALPAVPSVAAETICVLGTQPFAAPTQVSRTKICATPFCSDANATYRPSWLTAGVSSAAASEADAVLPDGAPDPPIDNVKDAVPPPRFGQFTRHTALGGFITLTNRLGSAVAKYVVGIDALICVAEMLVVSIAVCT
jgi:hypothetical protein